MDCKKNDNFVYSEKYKGFVGQLKNTCVDRKGRYISSVDRVEVNQSGSLT
jgi:hypothetical protein